MTKPLVIPPFDQQTTERFYARINHSEGCWIWGGKVSGNGYGRFFAGGHEYAAHRISLQLATRLLDVGKVVDHLCRNRSCVNPDHLEEVEHSENIERGLLGVLNPFRETCPQGHQIAGSNALSQGERRPRCRQCNRDYMREYMRERYQKRLGGQR